ncbi:MAG TPA: glycosyltransferase family 4 protein [Gaiellaceae bacterium]|nr:glycosyltransferase family 4 protein [Gaiellaceae bacterium]
MSRDRKLRVVFVDHVSRLSGGELALLGLVRALRDDVDAYAVLGEDGPLAERLREEGVAVEVLPLAAGLRDLHKDSVRPVGLSPRATVRLPGYVIRLARRLRRLHPDVVHTNSLKAALYGGAAGRLAGIPVVWHIRDRISDDYLPRPAVRLVRLAARILPTAVVANSSATLATLPGARRGSVVYNSVEPRTAASAKDHGAELTVGIVGRLAPWKGQHVFLEAFAEAFGDQPVGGRIVGAALFGEEEYALELRNRARDLGIAERIDFRGFREPIWDELGDLDVLVHCSVTPEPFGQVVLEGMAAGLAVVAADAGGPVELIEDGVDGLLVPPGDATTLAGALRRLHADPELRRRLGEAARERSRAFTPERSAAQLLEIYRAAC